MSILAARAPRILVAALFAAAAALLSACGSDEEAYVERPVEDLYNDAMDQLLEGDYELAATAFDEVERQHPYRRGRPGRS